MLFTGLAVTIARTNITLVLTQMVYIPNANSTAHNNTSSGRHLVCPVKNLVPDDDNETIIVVTMEIFHIVTIKYLLNLNESIDRQEHSLSLVAIHARIDFVIILLGIFDFRNSWRADGAKIWREKGLPDWHTFINDCYVYHTDDDRIPLVILNFNSIPSMF